MKELLVGLCLLSCLGISSACQGNAEDMQKCADYKKVVIQEFTQMLKSCREPVRRSGLAKSVVQYLPGAEVGSKEWTSLIRDIGRLKNLCSMSPLEKKI